MNLTAIPLLSLGAKCVGAVCFKHPQFPDPRPGELRDGSPDVCDRFLPVPPPARAYLAPEADDYQYSALPRPLIEGPYRTCRLCGTPYEACHHRRWRPAPDWTRRLYPGSVWVEAAGFTWCTMRPVFRLFDGAGMPVPACGCHVIFGSPTQATVID